MKIVRIYTGTDGESHFEETETVMETIQAAESVVFRTAPAGRFHDWHHPQRRQYVITLSGQWEIEIGDGTTRRFNPGDVLLAEDLEGRGHVSRVLGDQPRIYAVIPLKSGL
jgi:quercetin dioxygenase-like cupin family protein